MQNPPTMSMLDAPNPIGCSLPTTRFVADHSHGYGRAPHWFAMHENPHAYLAAFSEGDVRSVEACDIRFRTEPGDIASAIEGLQAHHMAVTLRTWSPRESDALADTIRITDHALSTADSPIPIAFHAHLLARDGHAARRHAP